jgi:DNA repair exonuclease SbcCD ATPase subunit
LQLRNWRAYANLTSDFEPGTTFVVARNGVGKTSMVSGLAWTLYDRPVAEVKASLHDGAPADGWVELILPNDTVLSVHRHFDGRRSTLEASVDGTNLSPDAYEAFLVEALGASTALLSRTTVMNEGDARPQAAEELHLRDHLCQVLGVTGLLELSGELSNRIKENEKATSRIRSAAKISQDQLVALRSERERLESDLASAKAESEALRAKYDDARRRLTAVESASALASIAEERDEQLHQIAVDLNAVTGSSPDAAIEPMLTRTEGELDAQIELMHRRDAELQARARYIRDGLASLNETGEGTCPVCRRPLRSKDVSEARTGHESELAAIEAEIAEIDNTALSERREALRELRRRLSLVPAVPDIPVAEVTLQEAQLLEREAQEALEDLVGRTRVLESQLADTASQVTSAENDLIASADATRHFRYEALLGAARSTADEVVRYALEAQIDPLAAAVRDRWKLLFGQRGDLHLDTDGSLYRLANHVRLPFAQFSAGERTTALLILRMLAVAASTRAGFVWVDEPLEHLDPDGRRRVASMLSQATAPTGLRQVLITTYEEPLARRLSERVDGVHLRYVRAA